MAENNDDILENEAQDFRVLNQEEIDALLGYGYSDEYETHQKNGLQAILQNNMVSYERLPMLEIVFDRLIRLLATSLRNYAQDNVEIALDSIESMRFGEYIDSLTLPTLISVFKAEEWDNYGLITMDSAMIYSMVDVFTLPSVSKS